MEAEKLCLEGPVIPSDYWGGPLLYKRAGGHLNLYFTEETYHQKKPNNFLLSYCFVVLWFWN